MREKSLDKYMSQKTWRVCIMKDNAIIKIFTRTILIQHFPGDQYDDSQVNLMKLLENFGTNFSKLAQILQNISS